MGRTRRVQVISFVDWNSQVHAARNFRTDPDGRYVLGFVLKKIEKELKRFERNYLFEISVKAYCGWHKGFSPTPLRRDLATIREEELHEMGRYPNMPLRSFLFGDTASGALPCRIAAGTGSHFPATCRDRGHSGQEEKMIDTALVSDLIFHSASPEKSWLLVLGEDIDLVPGVYTAEAFLQGTGRKIALLRSGGEKYLNCKGLESL